MKRIFVAEIVASTGSFTEQFQAGEVERRLKKDGQAYLSLALKDRTGEIDRKLWDIPAGLTIAEGEFVKVEAEIAAELGTMVVKRGTRKFRTEEE